MNENEYQIESAKASIKEGESNLKTARAAMEYGIRKAKADYETAVNDLRNKVEIASIQLERHKAWLTACETKVKEPYKNNED